MESLSTDSGESAARLSALLRGVADGRHTPGDTDLRLLADACRRYPYAMVFPLLRLLHDGSLSAGERRELQRRIALGVDDPRTVDALREAGHADFYPAAEKPAADPSAKTDDAIDLFLDTYGHRSAEEDALLERMIFNPVADYAEVLAREEQENLPDEPVDTESPQGRIDAFILSRHPAAQHAPAEPEPTPEPEQERRPIARPADDGGDALLSESLARIYVRQKRYEKAYDLIDSLRRRYPHRNAYFDDQLRFLRKLIINSRG